MDGLSFGLGAVTAWALMLFIFWLLHKIYGNKRDELIVDARLVKPIMDNQGSIMMYIIDTSEKSLIQTYYGGSK